MKRNTSTLVVFLLVGLIVILTGISFAQVSGIRDELNASERSRAVLSQNYEAISDTLREICTDPSTDSTDKCRVNTVPPVVGPITDDPIQGPQGPRGDTGPVGPQGSQGEPGEDGARGPRGFTGPIGPNGVPGDTGADGVDGSNGVDGTNGVDGASGPPGPAGPEGPQGPAGPAGADGEDGAPGWTCPSGADPQPFTFYAYPDDNPLSGRQQYTAYSC